MKNIFNLEIMKKGKSAWIVCLIVIILAGTVSPAPAQAVVPLAVPTIKILDISPTEITKTANSVMARLKDFVLNQLAYVAAKQILHQMTVATINWINSGFEGSPAFITNPSGFLLDAADQITGAFISNAGPLRKLCSPWNVDIRLALALGQYDIIDSRYVCTLGSLIENAENATINGYSIEGFVNGDFQQGGWNSFIALTTDPANNPYGAYLSAHSEMLRNVGKRQSGISQDLLQGDGFLSWQDCEDVPSQTAGTFDEFSDISTEEQKPVVKCETKTPGSVIASSLMGSVNSPRIELELAQDINAIISALISQLVSQVLTKGLSALSSGGSGVDGYTRGTQASYISQVYGDATSRKSVGTGGSGALADSNPTSQLLSMVKSIYGQAVDLVTDSRDRYQTARSCFSAKVGIAINNPGQASYIQSQISGIDSALQNRVTPLLQSLIAKQTNADTQLKQANTPGAGDSVVPGTSNIGDLAGNIQEQIDAYQNQIENLTVASTDLTTDAANADLESTREQVQIFNQESGNYQSACTSLR